MPKRADGARQISRVLDRDSAVGVSADHADAAAGIAWKRRHPETQDDTPAAVDIERVAGSRRHSSSVEQGVAGRPDGEDEILRGLVGFGAAGALLTVRGLEVPFG